MPRYAIVDIETAGFGPGDFPGITEIAIIVHDGEKIIESFESLIHPGCVIQPFVTRLTGITDEMVVNAPTFEELADELYAIMEDCIFIAHSVNFDYSFLYTAFRRVGIDFNRPRLCTVRLSRKIFPGLRSYSLGNICSEMGIEVENRHRAMGDASATVKLFEMCLANDTEGFIRKSQKKNSRETLLPPDLPKEVFENLPEKTGVYYFHDLKGKIIYVGKAINIKSRIISHFSAKKTKLSFFTSIANISYTLCGTELIALLLEASEIKKNFPPFNKAQKLVGNAYVLADYIDGKGIHHLLITKNHKVLRPHISFPNFEEARSFMFKLIEEFELCKKYCNIQNTIGACYDHKEGKCKGVCADVEEIDDYNKRVKLAIEQIQENVPTKMIIAEGRNHSEKSVVVIEKGIYKGFGYFSSDKKIEKMEEALEIIEPFKHTFDVQQILARYN